MPAPKGPKKSPRIQVTVSEPEYEVIQHLADLQGTSMSKVIGEMIGRSYPALLKIANLIELAKTAEVEMKSAWFESLRDLAESTDDDLRDKMAVLESVTEALQPPISNTGVNTSETRKKP